jgi:hypothetical protein
MFFIFCRKISLENLKEFSRMLSGLKSLSLFSNSFIASIKESLDCSLKNMPVAELILEA